MGNSAEAAISHLRADGWTPEKQEEDGRDETGSKANGFVEGRLRLEDVGRRGRVRVQSGVHCLTPSCLALE